MTQEENNTEKLKAFIEMRREEIKTAHWVWKQIQELNDAMPLKDSIMKEIQARISSRIAFLERSINDHSPQSLIQKHSSK